MSKIYLDNAATTPMYPEVISEMTRVMRENFGNPSSIHSFGRDARFVIDDARTYLAQTINSDQAEIYFTSGGTEANNLALLGIAEANQAKGRHIITTKIEHPSVLQACKELEERGFEVTYLAVDQAGIINIESLKAALRPDTILVSIMYGNNEVGSLQPIEEIGQVLAEHGAAFHTDAVQAYGIEEIDVKAFKIDALSTSGHKIGGPKACGFLFLKKDLACKKQLFGGNQEGQMRAGTENLPSIVGLKTAALICQQNHQKNRNNYLNFRKLLTDELRKAGLDFQINGSEEKNLAHILNISFPGILVEPLLVNLDLARIAVSSGSACTAGSFIASHVLKAMYGENTEVAKNSIRISFGPNNKENEIVETGQALGEIVKGLLK